MNCIATWVYGKEMGGVHFSMFPFTASKHCVKALESNYNQHSKLFIPTGLSQVNIALGDHPSKRSRRDNQGAQEATLQRGIADNQLSNKVCESDSVGPHGQVVRDRVVNVVGGGHANDSGQESPGTEDAAGERASRDLAIAVELGGVCGRAVGLQTVKGGDNGDLWRGALDRGIWQGVIGIVELTAQYIQRQAIWGGYPRIEAGRSEIGTL